VFPKEQFNQLPRHRVIVFPGNKDFEETLELVEDNEVGRQQSESGSCERGAGAANEFGRISLRDFFHLFDQCIGPRSFRETERDSEFTSECRLYSTVGVFSGPFEIIVPGTDVSSKYFSKRAVTVKSVNCGTEQVP
jgi:hypothetical protein